MDIKSLICFKLLLSVDVLEVPAVPVLFFVVLPLFSEVLFFVELPVFPVLFFFVEVVPVELFAELLDFLLFNEFVVEEFVPVDEELVVVDDFFSSASLSFFASVPMLMVISDSAEPTTSFLVSVQYFSEVTVSLCVPYFNSTGCETSAAFPSMDNCVPSG